MQIELSAQEIETVLRCVKAHITTLSAVMVKDTSGLFDNHKKDCEEIYKKLSDTVKDQQNDN
jgi:hypothetical protein